MFTTFKRADGLLICGFCGAIYSDIFDECPGCKGTTSEPTTETRYLCSEQDPCPKGGADGPCCVSCQEYPDCPNVCLTAKDYHGLPAEADILCEYMTRIEIKPKPKEETE